MADTSYPSKFTILRQTWITREDVKANPNVVYVFGDDAAGEDHRGLARHLRDLPNSHGISIGWGPHEPFSLSTSEAAIAKMDADLTALSVRSAAFVIWPLFGIVPEFQSMPLELRDYLRSQARLMFNLADPV